MRPLQSMLFAGILAPLVLAKPTTLLPDTKESINDIIYFHNDKGDLISQRVCL
jgi:hypothetical protein